MKKYQIKFTHDFNSSLESLHDFIFFHYNSPNDATKLINKIIKKCNNLSLFPQSSPIKFKTKSKEIRFAHIRDYTIAYHINEPRRTVIIDRLFYSKRNTDDLISEL